VKKGIALIAGLILLVMAGPAAAATFTPGNFVEVYVNDADNVEIGVAFGSIDDILAGGSQTHAAVNFLGKPMGNYKAAFFGYQGDSQAGYHEVYWATSQLITADDVNELGWNAFSGAAKSVMSWYDSKDGGTDVTSGTKASDAKGYRKKMIPAGTYATVSQIPSIGEVAMGGASSFDMYVWKLVFDAGNITFSSAPVATLTVNQDGSTTVTGNPVPVPAAVYLLGSGLIALLGIRRKAA